jgi:murein DD-endopeptidase MepM/ murein hydrolase activator NlpD
VGPYLKNMLYAMRLASMPPAQAVPVPVRGVPPRALRDTWGGARSGGRKHEGIDIFARRGTAVTSATEGIVMRVGTNRLGGQVVWVLGPGGQRHYYAHLDRYADGIKEGMQLKRGDLIGYVGVTGNSDPNAPHLHFAVVALTPEKQWWKGTPVNPYPLLGD